LSSIDDAQVVLEEVMTAAIDAARRAQHEGANGDPFQSGLLMAYYDVLDIIKTEADLSDLKFCDESLNAFDPDELLGIPRKPE